MLRSLFKSSFYTGSSKYFKRTCSGLECSKRDSAESSKGYKALVQNVAKEMALKEAKGI